MKTGVVVLIFILSSGFLFGGGGDPDQRPGEKIFKSPELLGSSKAVSCETCHAAGKGLEKVSMETYFKEGGGLAETINMCISGPVKGKELKMGSKEMKDLETYVRSFSLEKK